MREPFKRKALPGLGEVPSDLPGIRQFLIRLKEIIELREGRRGNGQSDTVVTFGDLENIGVTKVFSQAAGGASAIEAIATEVAQNQGATAKLAESLKKTKLFESLQRSIYDLDALKRFPMEIRSELATRVADLAAKQQSAVSDTNDRIQTATWSLAKRVESVTAAVDHASSGVRELTYAVDRRDKATAGKITQVESRLDGVAGVGLEVALDTWVSIEDGIYGAYTVKLNSFDEFGDVTKSAAFGLSVEGVPGAEETSFLVSADKFGIFTDDGTKMPFGVDASGVYVNGTLNVDGVPLDEIKDGSMSPRFASTTDAPSDAEFLSVTGKVAKNGDELIVSDAINGTKIYRRISGVWTNTTAMYIKGDAVIYGTLALNRLAKTSQEFDQTTFMLGDGTYVAGYGTGAAFTSQSSIRFAAIVANENGLALGVGNVATGPAGNFVNCENNSYLTNYTGGYIAARDYGARFYHEAGGTEAYLATGTYALEMTGGSSGSFTGAHDGLLRRSDQQWPEPGDIMIDVGLVRAKSVNDTICENSMSCVANQKGALGVFAKYASPGHIPVSLTDDDGAAVWNFSTLELTFRFVVINGIGEGLINVCGEAGDIEIGDLIVTSSIPGKGMRQADDIVRSITVARARESASFSSANEIKQIACVYLCG